MKADQLPPQIKYVYFFQAFNSISWQMCLAGPLILFARELGASALALGILAGLTPLASIVQMPFAQRAERIGYKRLTVSGWTSRSFILAVLVVLPFAATVIDPQIVVFITLLTMIAFTVLRGIGIAAWLPWISALVPRSIRGLYLSRDRLFVNGANLIALAVSGAILAAGHVLTAYAVVFGLGVAAAFTSLFFLRRMPDAKPITSPAHNTQQRRWRDLLSDLPYRRLVVFALMVQVVVAANAAFVIVFAREQIGIPDGIILWLTAAASLTGTFTVVLLRNRADMHGSKPFLWMALVMWVAAIIMWTMLAGGVAGNSAPWVAGALLVIGGVSAAAYDLSITRLLMNTVSEKPGNAQFFALNAAIVNIVAASMPIIWGALLDSWKNVDVMLGPLDVNRYTLFFGAEVLLLGLVAIALKRVREERVSPAAPGKGVG
jgi:MFS family permease